MGTKQPREILAAGLERFRCVSWDVLKENKWIFEMDVSTFFQDHDGQSRKQLYDLSEPCDLAACDAFLSHSWHDDKDLKLASLEKWCAPWSTPAPNRNLITDSVRKKSMESLEARDPEVQRKIFEERL